MCAGRSSASWIGMEVRSPKACTANALNQYGCPPPPEPSNDAPMASVSRSSRVSCHIIGKPMGPRSGPQVGVAADAVSLSPSDQCVGNDGTMGHLEVAHVDYYLPDGRLLLADASFRVE